MGRKKVTVAKAEASKVAKASKATRDAVKASANGKGKATTQRTTGNLPLEEAKGAFLRALLKGRKTRTELKAVAPYGNYTALCEALKGEGLINEVEVEESHLAHYELTAKGKAAAGAKGKAPATQPAASDN